MPNSLLNEWEVRERLQQRHREAQLERLLADLPRQPVLSPLIESLAEAWRCSARTCNRLLVWCGGRNFPSFIQGKRPKGNDGSRR